MDISGQHVVLGAYVSALFALIVSVYFIFSRPKRKGPQQGEAIGAGGDEFENELEMADDDESDDSEDMDRPVHRQREARAMTKKDILKAEKKRLKADRRAYMEAEREAKEARRQRQEDQRRERQALKEADSIVRQMEVDKKREEETKQRQEGEPKESGQDSVVILENIRDNFARYLKKKKMVFVEEAAADFRISAPECLRLVSKCETAGLVTCVADDRGRLLCVEEEELHAVAEFMRSQGRVSVASLTREVNKIIKFPPIMHDEKESGSEEKKKFL